MIIELFFGNIYKFSRSVLFDILITSEVSDSLV